MYEIFKIKLPHFYTFVCVTFVVKKTNNIIILCDSSNISTNNEDVFIYILLYYVITLSYPIRIHVTQLHLIYIR